MGERPDDLHRNEQADDRDLVLAFQKGSCEAFNQLYARHHARVRGVCTRLLHNPEDVQEATQETFLRAYQALGRFNGRYQVGAWLGTIATNVCVDLLRARSRRGALVLMPSIREDTPDPEPTVEERISQHDHRVHDAIARLQPLHAHALQLRALHGLSHTEMAGRLQMSPAQVKSLLHRARSSFKRAFDRAGNWLVAPVAAVRSLIHRSRDSAATSNPVIAITGTAGGAFAERAAAGALVAALALGSLPAQPQPRPTVEVPTAAGAPKRFAPKTLATEVGQQAARTETSERSAPTALDDPREAAGALVAEVGRVVEGSTAPPPPEPPDDDDVVPPSPPTTTGTNEIVEKVKEEAAHLLERRD
ncbi:MAG TPA: RNA polymerase sigma factor [Actinomycetota bacterium]|jgi:RNA polymerase sigma-70 factor, ECF subfamily|nr:RNA polymerase sigma factor [Actinomycetota bacterium]